MRLLVLEVLLSLWQRGGILAEPTQLGVGVSSPLSDLECQDFGTDRAQFAKHAETLMPEHLQLVSVAWYGKQEAETVEKQGMWRGQGLKKPNQKEKNKSKWLNKSWSQSSSPSSRFVLFLIGRVGEFGCLMEEELNCKENLSAHGMPNPLGVTQQINRAVW